MRLSELSPAANTNSHLYSASEFFFEKRSFFVVKRWKLSGTDTDSYCTDNAKNENLCCQYGVYLETKRRFQGGNLDGYKACFGDCVTAFAVRGFGDGYDSSYLLYSRKKIYTAS